eukprot:TRINITY_DN2145_c0_g1_i1.p1 TRINITY_DN2145_c0_g1~~TRINITY_DN2145_c0_g1_i1.p1  ORF type:complete len:492 (+),score=70.94 TRINITY_DN2145_c0_g1_i1:48-1523(+)
MSGFFHKMMNSLVGVVVGIVVFGVSLFILGWNEKRAVWTAQTIGYARDEYRQLNSCIPNPSNNNALVAIEGCEPTPSDNVTDTEYLSNLGTFNIVGVLTATDEEVFSWTRNTEQYVNHEKKDGDSYTYTPMWQSVPEIYSNPNMKVNPPSWPSNFKDISRTSTRICIGSSSCSASGLSTSFVLPTLSSWQIEQAKNIGEKQDLPLNNFFTTGFSNMFNNGTVCSNTLQTWFSVHQNRCVPTPAGVVGSTQVYGDFRFKWQQRVKRPGTAVSVLALQTTNDDGTIGFKEWHNPHHSSCSYCTIGRIQNGNATGDDILNDLESENKTLTWVLRFLGWLVCWFSLAMIFAPIAIAPTIVPFIGDFLGELVSTLICALTCVIATSISMLVIAIAWLAYRPAIGVPLMCVFVAGTVGAVIFLKRHKDKRMKYTSIDAPATSQPAPAYGTQTQYPPQQQYPPQEQYPPQQQYPPQAYPPQNYAQGPYPPTNQGDVTM